MDDNDVEQEYNNNKLKRRGMVSDIIKPTVKELNQIIQETSDIKEFYYVT